MNGLRDYQQPCEILDEGVDIPTIGCAVLLRPTKSLCVYLQQIGRGLRTAPGKTHLTVLDLAGNSLEHGLPDEVHHWTLAGAPKRGTGEAPGWLCGNCDCLNPIGAAFCLDCGAARPVNPRELIVDPQAELIEFNQREQDRRVAQLSYRAFMSRPRSRRELEIYQRAKGYRRGWIFYAEQQQAEAFGGAR